MNLGSLEQKLQAGENIMYIHVVIQSVRVGNYALTLFVRAAWKCGKPLKLVRFGFLIDNLDLLMSGAMPAYFLQISDWARWCPVIFWTGFKTEKSVSSKMLASLKQYTFYPPARVSHCMVKFSSDPLWRLACAYCSRWVNKLWLFFSPLPEYWLCQKGCMKLKLQMFFPRHETAEWFQKQHHSLCFILWKYLCLYLKMVFLRVAM